MQPTASRAAAACAVAALLAGPALAHAAGRDSAAPPAVQTSPARPVRYRAELAGFGRVAPAAPIWVRAGAPGRVVHVMVTPGERVHPGTRLLTLGGALMDPRLAGARTALDLARQRLKVAKDAATAARHRYPAFTDRTGLDRARAGVLRARAALAAARARLARLRGTAEIDARIAGRARTVAVSEGMDVRAGTPLVLITPSTGLLLHAEVFPRGWTPTVGTEGSFRPIGAGPAIPVRVVAVAPGHEMNGARELWLGPVGKPSSQGWSSGAAGRVTLHAAARPAVRVPVAALVLDRGRWWVLVRHHGKLQARAVRLAPEGVIDGILVGGLAPGEQVVVRDSYRLFHRDFALHYLPPS